MMMARGPLSAAAKRLEHLARHAEEDRPGETKHFDALGKRFAELGLLVGIECDQSRVLAHPGHEQERRERHSDPDGDRQVDKDGQQEGKNQDRPFSDVAPRQF